MGWVFLFLCVSCNLILDAMHYEFYLIEFYQKYWVFLDSYKFFIFSLEWSEVTWKYYNIFEFCFYDLLNSLVYALSRALCSLLLKQYPLNFQPNPSWIMSFPNLALNFSNQTLFLVTDMHWSVLCKVQKGDLLQISGILSLGTFLLLTNYCHLQISCFGLNRFLIYHLSLEVS